MKPPLTELHEAWNAGSPAARKVRQDELQSWWPALADALDKLRHVAVIQHEAAMQHMREHSEEHRKVTELVLGKDSDRRGRWVQQYVKLDDDYLVQVRGALRDPNALNWTFTVGGKATEWYYADQELAILHLLASRYDDNPNSNHMWAAAAARVLGVSEPEE